MLISADPPSPLPMGAHAGLRHGDAPIVTMIVVLTGLLVGIDSTVAEAHHAKDDGLQNSTVRLAQLA